jgi:ribosomal protein S18 acetylase RimI-like enzyme
MVGFVYLEEDHVAGFVIGSATPRRLRRDALSRNGWPITLHVAASVALHPRRIGALIDGLRGPTGSSVDDDDAELTYIGVSPRTRRGRVGTQLVDAFNDAMRDAGVDAYQLSVDGTNESAVSFYRTRGFRQIGRYRQFGALHVRYKLALDTSPSPREH